MIAMHNVRKNYENFQLELSLEIPSGTITGLVGRNGVGKSTVIKLILGLVKPDDGIVTVFGKEAVQLDRAEKQNIGTSLTDAGFCTQFCIDDVKKILAKMYSEFDSADFEEKCRAFHLPQKKKIKEFSTGMKAKLRLLTAITHHAKLLILDEPTAGLDVETRSEMLDMLREYLIEDEERTILITSHISSDLETLCDDIYLIDNGKLILHEDTDSILEQYGVLKMSQEQYEILDKEYLLKSLKMPYGYACFTKEKQFYEENYPKITVEKSGIDELILMMTGGYR